MTQEDREKKLQAFIDEKVKTLQQMQNDADKLAHTRAEYCARLRVEIAALQLVQSVWKTIGPDGADAFNHELERLDISELG